MNKSYVAKTDGGYRIAGSRVSLDSVVYDFLNGLSPESIADNYDTLSLEQVFGAVTYYLANQTEVDEYLARNREKFEELRIRARSSHPLLYKKLKRFKRSSLEDAIERLLRLWATTETEDWQNVLSFLPS
jgi:uncharacterized protein (DUF433 family)